MSANLTMTDLPERISARVELGGLPVDPSRPLSSERTCRQCAKDKQARYAARQKENAA